MPAFTRRQYAGAAAATTITAGINTSDTTCSLTATTGWPSTAAVPFYVVIDPGTSAEEKCSATISGSTLTLVRGQDDTSASSHTSGASIYPFVLQFSLFWMFLTLWGLIPMLLNFFEKNGLIVAFVAVGVISYLGFLISKYVFSTSPAIFAG